MWHQSLQLLKLHHPETIITERRSTTDVYHKLRILYDIMRSLPRPSSALFSAFQAVYSNIMFKFREQFAGSINLIHYWSHVSISHHSHYIFPSHKTNAVLLQHRCCSLQDPALWVSVWNEDTRAIIIDDAVKSHCVHLQYTCQMLWSFSADFVPSKTQRCECLREMRIEEE